MTPRRIKMLATAHYIARLQAENAELRAERVALAPLGGDYIARTTRPLLSGPEVLLTLGVLAAGLAAFVVWAI